MRKKENKDWQTAEKLTAILEKFITPDSTVEHNKYLPVIGRPERRKRQCDVVITFGSGLRKSVAIVEVQKRDSKPSLTTFHGWIKKMNEVGAQQLICVSKQGYPQSIIDDVKKIYGDKTVTLMNLEEFDYLSNPQKFNMLPIQILINGKFKFLEIDRLCLETKPVDPNMQINTNDPMFSIGEESSKLSLNDLGSKFIDSISSNKEFKYNELVNQTNILDFEINSNDNVFLHHAEGRFKIKKWLLKIELIAKKQFHNTKVKQYTYRQELINGTIAWIACNTVIINGVEKQLDLIFKTDGGQFSMTAMIRD